LICLTKRVDKYVEEKSNADTQEYCLEEKTNFYNYYKDQFRTEYENLIRIEANNL